MEEKLTDISETNPRTQKLSSNNDSGPQRSIRTALEKKMVNHFSAFTKNIQGMMLEDEISRSEGIDKMAEEGLRSCTVSIVNSDTI